MALWVRIEVGDGHVFTIKDRRLEHVSVRELRPGRSIADELRDFAEWLESGSENLRVPEESA